MLSIAIQVVAVAYVIVDKTGVNPNNSNMTSVDLIRSCLDSIRQISDEVSDAIVYLDTGCLEAFRFIGAFPLLLELGVYSVCSLEDSSPLDITVGWNSNFKDFARKIVIITSRLLSDAHRYILRCLGTHRTVLRCTIFTSVSEIAHSAYIDSPLGPEAFREYTSLLLQDYEELVIKCQKKDSPPRLSLEGAHLEKSDPEGKGWPQMTSDGNNVLNEDTSSMRLLDDGDSISNSKPEDGSAKLVLSVDHFPMVMCPLSPRVFVLPSEGIVAEGCLSNDNEDSLSPGLPSISTELPSDGEDVPPGLTLTAYFLYHLATKMDLKMEIFSLGGASKIIGKMLTDMSSLYDVGRRNKRSAGLLLIDRTLDLLTPCCHGDSFLDRILSTLLIKDRAPSPQNQSKHSRVDVQRISLDATVPFGTIFSKEEPVLNQTQLCECIKAFISGWDSAAADPKADDSVENVDLVQQTSDRALSLLSGSITSNHMGTCLMEELINKRANDGANLIKFWLVEALKQEKIAVTTKGRFGSITASEVRDLVTKLSFNPKSILRNKGIIQMGLAAEIALSEPHSSRWDAFVSAERILSISSADTSQSLSSQIRDLINTSMLHHDNMQRQGVLSFRDALLLSMTGYILAGENFPTSGSTGPFSWEEEHSLKEAVVDAILEKPSSAKFKFLHGLEKEFEAISRKEESVRHEVVSAEPTVDDFDDQWGSWDDEDKEDHNEQEYGDMQLKLELKDKVDHLFKFFHKLSGLKWRYPSLTEGPVSSASNFGRDTYSRKGLLYKVLSTALAKHNIPGLEYHSSAVGRFLKSGLGRFGLGQAKPSFGDQNVLLVFVVGGINSLEAREAMEAFSECGRPDSEMILGGTTLLTPDDMFELLLGSSSCL